MSDSLPGTTVAIVAIDHTCSGRWLGAKPQSLGYYCVSMQIQLIWVLVTLAQPLAHGTQIV